MPLVTPHPNRIEKAPGWRDAARTLGNYIAATVACFFIVGNFFRVFDYFYPESKQQIAESDKRQFDPAWVNQLAKVTLYGMADIGIAAHPPAGKDIYDQIISSPQALSAFEAILNNDSATLEAKAFALCGLKTLNSDHYLAYRDRYALFKGEISYMHGDVMQKIQAPVLASVIDKKGCF